MTYRDLLKTYRHMEARPDFHKSGGLVPAVAQDAESGEVLMLAWMNKTAWEQTVSTGRAVYWSRSLNRLWKKGERSGREQIVREILLDCDRDSVVLKVDQIGGRPATPDAPVVFTIASRRKISQ